MALSFRASSQHSLVQPEVPDNIKDALAQFALDQGQCVEDSSFSQVRLNHLVFPIGERFVANYRHAQRRRGAGRYFTTGRVSCDLNGQDLRVDIPLEKKPR